MNTPPSRSPGATNHKVEATVTKKCHEKANRIFCQTEPHAIRAENLQ